MYPNSSEEADWVSRAKDRHLRREQPQLMPGAGPSGDRFAVQEETVRRLRETLDIRAKIVAPADEHE